MILFMSNLFIYALHLLLSPLLQVDNKGWRAVLINMQKFITV